MFSVVTCEVEGSHGISDEEPKTTCPFTFHAQIHPSRIPEYLMQELESEIQKPTGISTVPPPKVVYIWSFVEQGVWHHV